MASPSAERLALYRTLADVTVVPSSRGGSVIAAMHPARPGIGTLGALQGGVEAIRAGEAWLRGNGCEWVLGPMEVATWFPYRARLGPKDAPSFPGEPLGLPDPWLEAGYRPVARYASTVVGCEAAIARAGLKRPEGVTFRPMGGAEETLTLIHRLSHQAFAGAFAFVPLPLEALRALYAPLLPRLDPRLVLIAERDGEPLGFVLGIPDGGGAGPDRFVVKTLAIHPRAQREGLGTWLTGALHRAAAGLGFREGIHALMWAQSHSGKVCAGRPLREYALFGRGLARA